MASGSTVKLTVWRKGEEKSISVALGELPKEREARATTQNSDATGTDTPKLGLMLAPAGQVAGSGSEGVVVTEVDPNGLASLTVCCGAIVAEGGCDVPAQISTSLGKAADFCEVGRSVLH